MPKALRVATREFVGNVTRPAFLFAAFGMPVFFLLVGLVVGFFTARGDVSTAPERVGYVDESGVLAQPVSVPPAFVPLPDVQAAEAALADNTVEAYFVVPANYRRFGRVQVYGVERLSNALEDDIDAFLTVNLAHQLNTPAPAERVANLLDRPQFYLGESTRPLSLAGAIVRLVAPMVLGIVLFVGLQLAASYLMYSVVEEKATRVLEVLMTSVTPMQLLTGKIIGLGALGLLQLVVYIGVGLLTLNTGLLPSVLDGVDLSGIGLPLGLLGMALLFFVLGYFLYGTLLVAVAVVIEAEQEARQWAGVVSLLLVLPIGFIAVFFLEPNGVFATAMSLVPFTSPVAMLLRMGFTSVPLWQVLLSLGLLLLSVVGGLWLAARLFRVSVLLTGQQSGWAMLRRALARNRRPVAQVTGVRS